MKAMKLINTYPRKLNAIADFVAGIESGNPTQPDFRNALQTQRVCDAVLASAADGNWKETGVEL